jgi:putative transposase
VDVDLERVLLFVTEGLSGIEGAMRRACPQGAWQRCVVHQMRGSPGQVKAQDRALVGQELKRVYKAEGRGSLLPWRG